MLEKILDVLNKILDFLKEWFTSKKAKEIEKTNNSVKDEVKKKELDKLNERWREDI